MSVAVYTRRSAARRLAMWLLLAAPWLGAVTHAQEKESAEPLDAVSVTAERDEPRRFSNAATVTVPHEELTRYGDTNLLEAMRRVPGITIDGTEIKFRGLGEGYTQVLINGDPAPLGFTLDSLSPDAVERIEVYKTPVAELSTASIAGTINIVLREKTRARHLSAKTALAYAEGNKSPSLTLEGSDSFRDFSFQLTGTAAKDMHTENYGIEEIDREAGVLTSRRLFSQASDSKEITYNLTPVLNWKRARDSLTWQTLAQRTQFPFLSNIDEQQLEGEQTDYPLSRSQARGPSRDLYKSNLTWTHEFSGGRSLESRLNVSYSRRASSFYFDGFDLDRGLLLDRNVKVFGLERDLVWKEKYAQPLGGAHALSAGWDISVSRRTDRREQFDRVPPAAVDVLDQDYAARVIQAAFYSQDEWTVSPSLSVYLGARVELTRVTVGGNDVADVHNNTTVASPIAQLVWKMPYNSRDQLRLGLARTTRPPTTFELIPRRRTANADNGPANPDSQGNPNLQPERAWGFDAAYESYLHGGGLVSLSGYVRHVDDVMVPLLFQDGTEWVATTTNDGTAEVYGTALELKLPLQKLLKLGSELQLKGDVSANWSKVSNLPGPSNRLDSQTPLSANLGLDWQSSGALSAGASIRFTPGYNVRETRYSGIHLGPGQSFDLYGAWQVNKTSRLRLSVENALHRDEVFGSYYADPDLESSRVMVGGAGPQVKLSFEIGR